MISLLSTAILGFDKVSKAKRERIARAFKERVFAPNVPLIVEGRPNQAVAYLIVEGECLK